MWSVWMAQRCFEPDVVMTGGSFSGAIISCQSFGHLWMYCVCLFGVEFQGRDDMLCNYYAEVSVIAAESSIWVAVETFVLPSVMIHCVCSNTQTLLNKHHLCLTFSCAILNLYKWDKGRKVSAFIKNLEVILKRPSHSVGYWISWIKLNCELDNLDMEVQNL